MNKQRKSANSAGIEWTDFTWNPVGGCRHGCRWRMPDGSQAICYAESVANRFVSVYPNGFEHHYWRPQALEQPLRHKVPSRIFVGSMADLMGYWVPDEQIEAVLGVCRRAFWHSFQLLTKNAPRLLKFRFPTNVWVGVSVPPSFMNGRELSEHQKARLLERQVEVLGAVRASVRWMSIEPLSFDVAPYLESVQLDWAVIGAASDGRRTYQPERVWVRNLLDLFERRGTPVFFKGNLEWPLDEWRAEFPRPSVIR